MDNKLYKCEICGESLIKPFMSKAYAHRCKKCVAKMQREKRAERKTPKAIGVKDCNGRDIRDGDVLKSLHYIDGKGVSHYKHHVVVWSKKHKDWFAHNIRANGNTSGCCRISVYLGWEDKAVVIDNIRDKDYLYNYYSEHYEIQ